MELCRCRYPLTGRICARGGNNNVVTHGIKVTLRCSNLVPHQNTPCATGANITLHNGMFVLVEPDATAVITYAEQPATIYDIVSCNNTRSGAVDSCASGIHNSTTLNNCAGCCRFQELLRRCFLQYVYAEQHDPHFSPSKLHH